MKILSFSDIHIDVNSAGDEKFLEGFTEYLKKQKDVDLVICAGDVSPRVEEIRELLDLVVDTVEAYEYVFVPGNHDIWETTKVVEDGISRIKYEEQLPQALKTSKFHYLPEHPIVVENYAILGNIGWYDYTLRNKKWDNHLKEDRKTWYWAKTYEGGVWNDAVYAEWGMRDKDVVSYCLNQLKNDYEKIKHISSKIMCLHHIPFREGVLFKDDLNWDYFSAFMGSERFGTQILDWNIDLVFYGHTHSPHQYSKGNSKVYCPAIGYKHEWNSNNLEKMFSKRIMVIDE